MFQTISCIFDMVSGVDVFFGRPLRESALSLFRSEKILSLVNFEELKIYELVDKSTWNFACAHQTGAPSI